jgi:hypothetical protein
VVGISGVMSLAPLNYAVLFLFNLDVCASPSLICLFEARGRRAAPHLPLM